MDFRVYDAVLDPVIVVCHNRIVRYANSAAIKWLNVLNGDGIINQPLTHFVDFAGSDELSQIEKLQFYQHTKYGQAHFTLKLTPFSGMAKLAIQRFPSDLYTLMFAIFVRDRAFAQVMSDEESIELITRNVHLTADQLMPDVTDQDETGVSTLDGNTITRNISAHNMAKFESQANVQFIDLKKMGRGRSESLSENWIEIIMKNFAGLDVNLNCNLEIVGNAKLRGFTTVGSVMSVRAIGEDALVRIKFGTLSPLTRKAIDDYLAAYAIKLD